VGGNVTDDDGNDRENVTDGTDDGRTDDDEIFYHDGAFSI
jgi:hypothetical protein